MHRSDLSLFLVFLIFIEQGVRCNRPTQAKYTAGLSHMIIQATDFASVAAFFRPCPTSEKSVCHNLIR